MNLEIHPEAYQAMTTHAEATFPYECCGFFYGQDANGQRQVQVAIEAPNSKEGDQRRRFEISPLDYMKAERYADENGLTLLGIYHSHPNHPARPSEHDLRQAVPFFSYIIVSVMEGQTDKVTSWQLDDTNQFEEEPIAVAATL